jgi:HEAT repeat protein
MILGLLRQPDSREALLEGTKSADRQIRRLAYRLGAECSGPAAGDLVRAALEDEDQLVRLWAARRVAGTFGPDQLPEILDILEQDPFTAVRQHALDVRLEHLPDTAESKLLEFLLDRSAGVRGHCHYSLRKRFQHDPAAEYREQLAGDPVRLRECILGLGEVGEAADANDLESYLDDPRTRIRAAAIRAVARLSKDPPVEKLIQALQEPSGGVSREAREALKRFPGRIPPDTLNAIYRGAQERHVRKNALLVVTRLGLWDCLPILVKASCDRDERLRELGRGFVGRWMIRSNRVQVVPNQNQVRRVRESLDSCSNRMDEAQRTGLEFVLRTVAPR